MSSAQTAVVGASLVAGAAGVAYALGYFGGGEDTTDESAEKAVQDAVRGATGEIEDAIKKVERYMKAEKVRADKLKNALVSWSRQQFAQRVGYYASEAEVANIVQSIGNEAKQTIDKAKLPEPFAQFAIDAVRHDLQRSANSFKAQHVRGDGFAKLAASFADKFKGRAEECGTLDDLESAAKLTLSEACVAIDQKYSVSEDRTAAYNQVADAIDTAMLFQKQRVLDDLQHAREMQRKKEEVADRDKAGAAAQAQILEMMKREHEAGKSADQIYQDATVAIGRYLQVAPNVTIDRSAINALVERFKREDTQKAISKPIDRPQLIGTMMKEPWHRIREYYAWCIPDGARMAKRLGPKPSSAPVPISGLPCGYGMQTQEALAYITQVQSGSIKDQAVLSWAGRLPPPQNS